MKKTTATGEAVGRGGNKVNREKTEIDERKETEGGYMCERLCALGLDHNLEARC